ncbi:MAG: class I SAM-dependent methyltransferase [Pyrinomonadaceae bacterium]
MKQTWWDRKLEDRGRRALERQLDYQRKKAAGLDGHEDEHARLNFVRAQQIRQKLAEIRPISETDKILEVGSGAHGLVFGLGSKLGIGVDPLAVEYKQLFPKIQSTARSVAAIGEHLPFADAAFDIVLSDNVIDHATRPLDIIDELIRVLKPGGLLYFTVNVHHPIYDLASRAHGLWNALGLKLELSAFADHTIHLTNERIKTEFEAKHISVVSQSSTIEATKAAQRRVRRLDPDSILKNLFYKNAVFELIARRTDSRSA